MVKNVCLNYYSRNLVLFNIGGDNASVFQRVSMNLNMTVCHAACQLLCQDTQRTMASSCVCWIAPIATCDSIKRTSWLFMFEMHLTSGITDRWQGCEPLPPTKLDAKTGPLHNLYFGIYCSFDFSSFFSFSECFPVISGFCIAVQYRICYWFSTILWVLASGLPSAKFPPGSNH